MPSSMRTLAAVSFLALLAGACNGAGEVTVEPGDPESAGEDETPTEEEQEVLSSCEPTGGQESTTLVEPSGELPSVATMEEAVDGHPDFEHMVEQLQEEGHSREEALHSMYAQVVGDRLLADARQLPGFVSGANARPLHDEPFELSFSGELPEQLDPDAYDLDSFGLEVTTGAAGFDEEVMSAAFEAAEQVGMRFLMGTSDETDGTARIEVLHATPEQVDAWEEAVEGSSRVCLVLAPRSVPCDDAVIAEAEDRAARQGEVLPNEQGGQPLVEEEQPAEEEGPRKVEVDPEARRGPTTERAEEVRRSYLGLTLEAAEDKAAEEDRAVRVVVEDGVRLGRHDNLSHGRLSLTVCDGIVVDTRMDLEPEE